MTLYRWGRYRKLTEELTKLYYDGPYFIADENNRLIKDATPGRSSAAATGGYVTKNSNGDYILNGVFNNNSVYLHTYQVWGMPGNKQAVVDVDGNTHYYYYVNGQLFITTGYRYYKGKKLGTVTHENRSFYPDNGDKEDYWYVYEGIENQAPKISGADSFLGNKSSNFRLDYIVTDNDLNDIVKVEIQEDKREPKIINEIKLGVKNYLDINVEGYELGDHTITIKATDSQGETAIRTYRWTKINNAPLISGSDKDLGEKNTAFTVTYQVSDADNDIVNVVEKVNGKVIRNLNNASKNTDLYLNITQEQILSFEVGKTNTIEIEATDTKGGVSYRRYTFKKTNLPPIISGNDRDLGVIDKVLTYSYSVTDPENDDIFVDVLIDDVYVERDVKVEAGKSYKVEVKGLDFLKLKHGKHTLKIMATDKKSDKVVRLINFTRDPKRLVVMSAKPIETDAAAKKFYFNPVWKVAVGAEGKIEACNNGFDTNPAWEDVTSTVKAGKTFNFINQSKQASKWGIAVKLTIDKKNATAISWISTTGGAFE